MEELFASPEDNALQVSHYCAELSSQANRYGNYSQVTSTRPEVESFHFNFTRLCEQTDAKWTSIDVEFFFLCIILQTE